MSTSGTQSIGEQQSSSVELTQLPRTKLLFHSQAHQQTYEHRTTITAIQPVDSLSEADQAVFKAPTDISGPFFALAVESTIFHPQGGGQPSDVGTITINNAVTFRVLAARTSPTAGSIVLHFGHFTDSATPPTTDLLNTPATQHVDPDKRHLYSRLHTAGHVVGTATRTRLESRIPNFDELKASHFPDSASCEFQGSIDGKYKSEIQEAVDELVAQDAEVRIEWWTKEDFRKRGLERLMVGDEDWRAIAVAVDENGAEGYGDDKSDDEKTRIRVVNIVGAEVYPCGGTHVPGTKECGKVTVRKISRQKGNSRVSYLVD